MEQLLPYALTTLQRVKDRIWDNRGSSTTATGNGAATLFEVPSGVIDNSNTTFTPLNTPLYIVQNGSTYYAGGGYNMVAGNIVLDNAVGVNGKITSAYSKPFAGNPAAYQPATFDTLLTRMINSFTDYFERECYNRRFVQATRVHEIYSMSSARQKKVVLRNAPVVFLTVTGSTTVGSATVSGISSTTAMVVGMPINGDGIVPNATIASIGNTTITLSAAASKTAAGTYFQANGVLSFQFRAGPPSNPSWTDFTPDQFELVNDGKAGVLRIYGSLPSIYSNMARVSYASGYAVDWTNAGNGTTHQLPASISECVENIVVRRFKRRMLAGKGAEALDGATTSWNRDLDQEDLDVIAQFRRMPTIF